MSVAARLPVAVATESSVTEPVAVPVIVAASLVPLMAISICRVVPSAVATVTSSCSTSPTPRAWIAALALSSV